MSKSVILSIKSFKESLCSTGEADAQQSRALAAPAEVLGPMLGTYVAAHNHLEPQFYRSGHPLLTSKAYTFYMQAKHPHT